jgi:hypothetical protein
VIDPAAPEVKEVAEGEQQKSYESAREPGNGGLLSFIPLGLMILCTAFIYHHLQYKGPTFCNTGIPEGPADFCADFTIPTTNHVC